MRVPLLALLLCPALALGQNFSFEGLDLKKPDKPDKPEVLGPAPAMDRTEGDPLVALPPRRDGKVDLEAYRVLHAALAERLGPRLVPLDATVKAIEREKAATRLAQPEVQRKLAAALKAELVVLLELSATRLDARLSSSPGGKPVAQATLAWARGRKLTLGPARTLVADLFVQGDAYLQSMAGLDLTQIGAGDAPPVPAASPPAPVTDEAEDDVAATATGVKATSAPALPLVPAAALVFAGGGASFRSLQASSAGALAPGSPSAMASFGFDVQVHPLRWVPALAEGPWADLWVEGAYRFNLVQGQVVGAAGASPCKATDDEVVARVGYRYPLPGWLPRVGVTAGVAFEQTTFDGCSAPALDTRYGATEVQLKILQPLLGETLALDLGGGPRFLFSTRARGFDTLAFSAEGWVTARLGRWFTGRAGARVTGTQLTTWPDGYPVFDLKTFVGVQLGVAL